MRCHIWRMDWDENAIRLYVDDQLLNDVDLGKTINEDGTGTNPFRQPHYLIVNLAIGGQGGDPSATEFPARYEIDYIRVYQKEEDRSQAKVQRTLLLPVLGRAAREDHNEGKHQAQIAESLHSIQSLQAHCFENRMDRAHPRAQSTLNWQARGTRAVLGEAADHFHASLGAPPAHEGLL